MKKLLLVLLFFSNALLADEIENFDVDDYSFSWEYAQVGDLTLSINCDQDSIYTVISGDSMSDSIRLSKSEIPQLIKALEIAFEKGEDTETKAFTVKISDNDGNKIASINSGFMNTIIFSPKKLDDLARALKDANERMNFIKAKLKFDS